MKQVHSSRQVVSTWHLGEKATIDHLVRLLAEPINASGTVHSAYTPSGAAIEDQIRKAWRPETAGLAMF